MFTKEQIKKIDTVYDYLNEIKSNTTNQALVDSINAIAKELSSVVREIEFAPSTEREVWINDESDSSEDVEIRISTSETSSLNHKTFCPLRETCSSCCAWFRIQNGLAMCGDKVIGKLIEKEETKCTL